MLTFPDREAILPALCLPLAAEYYLLLDQVLTIGSYPVRFEAAAP